MGASGADLGMSQETGRGKRKNIQLFQLFILRQSRSPKMRSGWGNDPFQVQKRQRRGGQRQIIGTPNAILFRRKFVPVPDSLGKRVVRAVIRDSNSGTATDFYPTVIR